MYNQNFQSSIPSLNASTGFASQQRYQPVGYVQSQYQSANQAGQYGSAQPFGAAGQFSNFQAQQSFQSPQAYHTANYRGDQPGHDAWKRSDSANPAQSQYGFGAAGMGTSGYGMSSMGASGYAGQGASAFGASNYAASNYAGSGYGASNQAQFGQFANPQSYHTANYRGDQPGHDAWKRSDSAGPTQQYGMNAGQYGASSFGAGLSGMSQSFGAAQNQFGMGMGTSNMAANRYQTF